MRTANESTCRLPYEIMEMITAHLTRDLGALKACSLACRFWYTVTAPHLHHTLILKQGGPGTARGELKPLSKLHKLGLVPLVKQIRVIQWGASEWFTPRAFGRRDRRYFSAFANVQTLVLHRPQLDCFTPHIERYFVHFSPSLRSLTLFTPRCTPQQLSYFLSLFSNLDNIEIWHTQTRAPNTTALDTKLAPFSTPKLQGRLALYGFHWAETWTHLITWCGGLRFRHLDLRGSSSCASLLLEACAETVETLRFKVTKDLAGK